MHNINCRCKTTSVNFAGRIENGTFQENDVLYMQTHNCRMPINGILL